MSSEQPLPKQSEAQDGVRWMGGKETRGVATCATAAAAGSTPATAAADSRGPKRRAAESRGCGRGLLAGNYGRSSAARGSVQIAKRAAAPNHVSRPRRMPSGAPYRWAHPSNTEHAPGGEGGPGCPGQSGPPSSKRRPVCVLNEATWCWDVNCFSLWRNDFTR